MDLKLFIFLLIPIVLQLDCISSSTLPLDHNAFLRMEKKMDPTANPCDDFYEFACGKYINSSESATGENLIDELLEKIKNQLISSLQKNRYINDSEPVKIAKYLYQTCVNTSAIDEQGLSPFLNILEQIGGWPVLKENKTWNETAFNWDRVIFKIGNEDYWNNIFLPMTVYQNPLDITQFNIKISEPKLGVDPSDLKDGSKNINVKNYFNYMVNLAVSMGANKMTAAKDFFEIIKFEHELANITTEGKQIYDPRVFSTDYKNFLENQITLSDLMNNYPFFPWEDYLINKLPSNVTLTDIKDKITVSNLNYINDLNHLIQSTQKRVLANYVIWKYVDYLAIYLTQAIRDTKKRYENEIFLNDEIEETKLRSFDCFEFVSSNMELAMGTLYARENFDKNTESNVSVILDNVHSEFIKLLQNASWLDEETKDRSVEKAKGMFRILGNPKELLDDSIINKYYQDLKLLNDYFIVNVFNVLIHNKKIKWKNFDSEAGKEWIRWVNFGMAVHVPNAFYRPDGNVLFAPAGFLQSPLYNYNFPIYMNYAGIGRVLGHEVVHGFDIKNRKFDKNDNVVNWPKTTLINYRERTQCLLDQYSNFGYSGNVRGETMLNEDIADNGGIRAAYFAYEKLINMDKSQEINGKVYTPRQLFWISAASTSCIRENDLTKMDLYHSPSKYRVIGSFSNMKEFANDFNCSKDSPMNPLDKCQLW